MDDSAKEELIGLAHEWDRAMIANDAEAIGRYMADDWTIIGPDGSVVTSRPSWSWSSQAP